MHKFLAVGKYKWVRKPTQSQPGTPEIGRSNAQTQCSSLSLSFCQTKHPINRVQKSRVNVQYHQGQKLNQKQRWTFVQAPGAAQDKNKRQMQFLEYSTPGVCIQNKYPESCQVPGTAV